MSTAEEIQALEAKLNAARQERLADVGDLAIAPVEEVTLGKFGRHGDALRLQDPIKYAAIQRNLLVKFVQTQMIEGQDFGTIPGVKEKCLFKPGAERCASLFNYSISVDCVSRVEDYDKGLFAFTYKATIKDCAGRPIAECEGNCNSKEKKYAYRNVNEKWASDEEKKASIGTKEVKGEKYTNKMLIVPNDDIYSIVNTIMKMSQKRAVVGAVILACNASSFFKNAETLSEMPIPTERPMWEGETIEAQVMEEPKTIDGDQRKELLTIAQASGYKQQSVKNWLSSMGIESLVDIESSQYDLLCKQAAQPGLAQFWNSQLEPIPSLD